MQIFILGILLAYVFEKTKSLVATITIHSIHNSITFALILYFRQIF
ncbi:MAG: CPBP family glutamic-type intramembrane protease [Candidatus Anammoxibacter sp.]